MIVGVVILACFVCFILGYVTRDLIGVPRKPAGVSGETPAGSTTGRTSVTFTADASSLLAGLSAEKRP